MAAHVAVVEAEHRVGLGELLGELLAVALGQAADRDDLLGAPSVMLEVGRLEERVDGVLLGLLDEAARVDDRDIGLGRVVDQPPPSARSRPASSSESTSLRVHPRVTRATLLSDGVMRTL